MKLGPYREKITTGPESSQAEREKSIDHFTRGVRTVKRKTFLDGEPHIVATKTLTIHITLPTG